jgi:hypothetical protein
VTDESHLQLTVKDGDSALSLSKARSGLIARGRSDAATLAVRFSGVTGEAAKVSIPEGVCNKCGERRELVLADCVCGSCRDSLDKEWADVAATDWVFVAVVVVEWGARFRGSVATGKPAGPELSSESMFQREVPAKASVVEILGALRASLASAKPRRPDKVYRYVFRHTTYAQMKLHWATCSVRANQSPWVERIAGLATPEDEAQMRLVCERSKRPDSPDHPEDIAVGTFGGWPLSRLVFIRPANLLDIAEYKQSQHERERREAGKLMYYYSREHRRVVCKNIPEGEQQENAEAVHIFRKATEQGNDLAQYDLGLMYYNGGLGNGFLGVTQDYAEAARWYRKAAEQGNAGAQTNLGLMYVAGQGVPEDNREGIKWFRKAAEQDHAVAQFNLGLMYQNGAGVPQDYVTAHMWLNLAAARAARDNQRKLYNLSRAAAEDNQKEFFQTRDALEAKMTPEQIAEAQRLAREWKPMSAGP